VRLSTPRMPDRPGEPVRSAGGPALVSYEGGAFVVLVTELRWSERACPDASGGV